MLELRHSKRYPNRALLVFDQQTIAGRHNMAGIAIVVIGADYVEFALVAAPPAYRSIIETRGWIDSSKPQTASALLKLARASIMSLKQPTSALREAGIVRSEGAGAAEPLGFDPEDETDIAKARAAYLAEFDALGLAKFRAQLDQRALATLAHVASPEGCHYGTLAGRQDAARASRFIAFCDRFPMLSEAMLRDSYFSGLITERGNAIDALNRRYSFKPSIQTANWTAGHLRTLGRAHWPIIGLGDASAMLRMCSAVPHNWIPTTLDEARAAIPFADVMGSLTTGKGFGAPHDWRIHASPLRHPAPDRLLARIGGRWREGYDRLSGIIGQDLNRFASLASWIADAGIDFRRRVHIPALFRTVAPNYQLDIPVSASDCLGLVNSSTGAQALRLFCGNLDLFQLAQLSADWHRRVQGRNLGFDTGIEAQWQGLTSDYLTKSGSIIVVPLTTISELKDEGRNGVDGTGMPGLFHCVGTYAPQCSSGFSSIVSIRRLDEEGRQIERLGTAEIKRKGEILAVQQHRGFDNADPEPASHQALTEYLDAIKLGQIAVNIDALKDVGTTKHAVPVGDSFMNICLQTCGYDWRDTERFNKEFEFWRPLLPRPLRHFSPEDFGRYCAQDCGITDFLKAKAA
ncbi:PcfJ domain-containing protein [Bosea sp. RAC05]|uniref:PcfJ domain-containing protein n=1 Tax=Bosea sp. RAC05 TaxID=1842539 RepID=UPI0008562AEA|nr:PcfJ domain-containing protein [Bosea sp. RAC05]AOG02769.1 pcfJ-like family protein [Bosea sp. RAC05]